MKLVDINSVCDIEIGKTPARKESLFWGKGNKWISIYDMKTKYIITTREEITNKAVEKSKIKLVPQDTVIMSFKLSVGKVAITGDDMYTNEAIAAFHIKSQQELTHEYLYYALQTLKLDEKTDRAVMGLTLNKKKLMDLQIPLFPLQTQKKIVEVLDKAQELIDLRKKQIELLDELIQSVFYDMFGDPVINSKGWEIDVVENIIDNDKYSIKAGPFGSALKKEYYVESGYKIYGQEQVIRDDFTYGDYYIDEAKYQELRSCKIKKGDVLISLVGTFGKISIVPDCFEAGIINPRLMKITLDKNRMIPVFFKSMFSSTTMLNKIQNMSHGGTMGILNTKKVKLIDVIVPDIKLQMEFVEKKKKIEEQKQLMQKSLTEMENNFNSLMQRAFKGELFN